MAETIETIEKIQIGDNIYSIDAQKLGGENASYFQKVENITQTVTSSSTDTEYPSAQCVYGIMGNIENLLRVI